MAALTFRAAKVAIASAKTTAKISFGEKAAFAHAKLPNCINLTEEWFSRRFGSFCDRLLTNLHLIATESRCLVKR